MTIDTLIMFSGAFVALLPFLGFPLQWHTVMFFILGIFIIALGISVRRSNRRKLLREEHVSDQHVPYSSEEVHDET